MKPLLSLALFSAFAVGAFAQTAPAPAPATPPAAQPKSVLEVARTDNDVLLAWTLPDADIKAIEIMRNTTSTAAGRGRVAAVRKEVSSYKDQVPDATAVYWYWLKLTRPTGEVINIGPVPTPTSKVWTPAP